MTVSIRTIRAQILLSLLVILGLCCIGAARADHHQSAQKPQAVIEGVLMAQQAAWNDGDIDAFMTGYWKSDQLRFASGGAVQTGWQATKDRYLQTYPDRAAMGTLTFSDLDIELLSGTDALVFGRFLLEREADAPSGLFTLHFRRFGKDWLIVSDHTSSAD